MHVEIDGHCLFTHSHHPSQHIHSTIPTVHSTISHHAQHPFPPFTAPSPTASGIYPWLTAPFPAIHGINLPFTASFPAIHGITPPFTAPFPPFTALTCHSQHPFLPSQHLLPPFTAHLSTVHTIIHSTLLTPLSLDLHARGDSWVRPREIHSEDRISVSSMPTLRDLPPLWCPSSALRFACFSISGVRLWRAHLGTQPTPPHHYSLHTPSSPTHAPRRLKHSRAETSLVCVLHSSVCLL